MSSALTLATDFEPACRVNTFAWRPFARRLLVMMVALGIGLSVCDEVEADRGGRRHFKRTGHSQQSGITQYSHIPTMREDDEVWFVNTRGMRGCDTDPDAFQVRYVANGIESNATIEDLIYGVNQDDGRITVFFVHGNRTNYYWAVQRGWLIYNRVITNDPEHQSVRLVVWAWPSEQETGPIRDFREKAQLADFEGRHFGWVLRRIRPTQTLGLIGYSFGARVVMNGLNRVARFGFQTDERVEQHALNLRLLDQLERVKRDALAAPLALSQFADLGVPTHERRLNRWLDRIGLDPMGLERLFAAQAQEGRFDWVPRPFDAGFTNVMNLASAPTDPIFASSQESPVEPISKDVEPVDFPHYNVALVAAAFDRDWILPGNCFGDAYDLADRVLLINNCQDKALKYFGFIRRGSFPTALGKVGPGCWQRLSDLGAKIQQIDVSREVGSEHRIDLYFSSPTVISRLHEEILHDE